MREQQEEIELNFRLDHEGRTAPSSSVKEERTTEEEEEEIVSTMDYSTQTAQARLYPVDSTNNNDETPLLKQEEDWLEDLLLDCQVADSALMPRTFWMDGSSSPRCSLEQMAMDVFCHHTRHLDRSVVEVGGAEWWVQIRPSPQGGRYSVLCQDNNNNNNNNEQHVPEEKSESNASDSAGVAQLNDKKRSLADTDQTATKEEEDLSEEGISFHWDKDEDLRLLLGGTTYIHPHKSTVTYLTSRGAPTLALQNCKIHPLTGEWISSDSSSLDKNAFLSWPRTLKHLSFDGRWLHAAPPTLAAVESLQKAAGAAAQNRKEERRERRVTFLVNIWLHYRPLNVDPFPESMLDKLSGSAAFWEQQHSSKQRLSLSISNDPDQVNVVVVDPQSSASTITWPMGDCGSGETIEMYLPTKEELVAASEPCGNCCITWPGTTTQSWRLHKQAPLPKSNRTKHNQRPTATIQPTKTTSDYASQTMISS